VYKIILPEIEELGGTFMISNTFVAVNSYGIRKACFITIGFNLTAAHAFSPITAEEHACRILRTA